MAMAMRLAVLACGWAAPQRMMRPDSAGYADLAHNLTDSGKFQRDSQPEIFRTPGYPLFLTAFTPFGQGWLKAAAAFQVLLDLGAILMTAVIATILLDRRRGWYAAAWQSVAVASASAAALILSDSLFAFLLTAAVLLLVSYLKGAGPGLALAAAVVLAMATYVRPVGLAYFIVAAVVLVARPKAFPRLQIHAAAFAVTYAALLAPWVVRNASVADYPGFSSFTQESMFAFSAPRTLAAAEGLSVDEARDRLGNLARLELAETQRTPGDQARVHGRIARNVITEHPHQYAAIHARGTLAFFLPAAGDVLELAGLTTGERGTLAVLAQHGPWAAAKYYFADSPLAMAVGIPLCLIWVCCLVAAVIGAAGHLRLRMSSAAWLIVLMVAVAALLPGPANHPRFRVPVMPLFSIAAAAGTMALADMLKRRSRMGEKPR